MKEIIYNNDNINLSDITSISVRIKVLLINNGKLLIGNEDGCFMFIGGHKEDNEILIDTLKREVKEETGLDVRNAEGGYLFTYKRENPGEGDNYFVDVYRFVMDIDESDLHLQTEETDGYMFATVDEIKAFAAEGKFLHYDSIKKAFEM